MNKNIQCTSAKIYFLPFIVLLFCMPLFLSLDGNEQKTAVLYKNDFSQESLEGFRIIDQGKNSAPSKWNVTDGVLVQHSNIYSGGTGKPGTMAVTGSFTWTDYVFETKFRSTDDDVLGLVFYYQDPDTYYRLRFSGTDKSNKEGKVLEKVSHGKWSRLAENPEQLQDDSWHTVRIIINGARILVFYDDLKTPLFDITDSDNPLKSGKIGFYSWGNTKSYFDDTVVKSTPLLTGFSTPSRLIPLNKKISCTLTINNFSSKTEQLTIRSDKGLDLLNDPGLLEISPGKELQVSLFLKGKELKDQKIELLKNSRVVDSMTFFVASDTNFLPLFGDFHMHTTYSDGRHTPVEMVIKSKQVGQDVIAITDHGTTAGAKAGKAFVTKSGTPMLVIQSEENACDFPNTHTLAFNVMPRINHVLSDCPPSIKGDREKIRQWAMDNGILLFQAHPVWKNHTGTQEEKLAFTKLLIETKQINGFELINGSPESEINEGMTEFYYQMIETQNPLPVTGGSDAHSTGSLGNVRTLLFVKEYSTTGVLEALKESRSVVINKTGSIILGPDYYTDLARFVIEDFLPEHDRLAALEGRLLYLTWGGHEEKKAELEKVQSQWSGLYKKYFPYSKVKFK